MRISASRIPWLELCYAAQNRLIDLNCEQNIIVHTNTIHT